jgi:cell division septal protein FtsQ
MPGVDNLRSTRRVAAIRITVLVLVGAALACLALGGRALAGQMVPRRIVVRGCWLTGVSEVLTAAGFAAGMSMAELRRGAAAVSTDDHRWLRAVDVRQTSLHAAVLEVEERCPLLKVDSHGVAYWLCDDLSIVRCDDHRDVGKVFDDIRHQPLIELPQAEPGRTPSAAADVLLAAACCAAVMPNTIAAIRVDSQGEFNLYDQDGLRIRLGEPVDLAQKIGAVPKALRLCQPDHGKLEYLDARNPAVFYEKWAEPIS